MSRIEPPQDSLGRTLDREAWSTLCPLGERIDTSARARNGYVELESDDGTVSVIAHALEKGVDIRVRHLQIIVKDNHVKLVQSHPPYPIERWTLLWEGDLQ